jgi:hypothetical protein
MITQICASGLGCHFVVRPFDITAFFSLQKFTAEDKMMKGDNFKYLVTSGDVADSKGDVAHSASKAPSIDGDETLHVVEACFYMVSSKSPEYANIDQSLEIDFHTLHFLCNRETVAVLIDFALNISSVIR